MKRLSVLVILMFCCVLILSAGGSTEGNDSNKLVLITASADDNLNSVIPAFEEKTGIDVEIITGSTGETGLLLSTGGTGDIGLLLPISILPSDTAFKSLLFPLVLLFGILLFISTAPLLYINYIPKN